MNAWDVESIAAVLRDVAECLRGAGLDDVKVRALHVSVLALKRCLGDEETTSSEERLRDLAGRARELLDEARALRCAQGNQGDA